MSEDRLWYQIFNVCLILKIAIMCNISVCAVYTEFLKSAKDWIYYEMSNEEIQGFGEESLSSSRAECW